MQSKRDCVIQNNMKKADENNSAGLEKQISKDFLKGIQKPQNSLEFTKSLQVEGQIRWKGIIVGQTLKYDPTSALLSVFAMTVLNPHNAKHVTNFSLDHLFPWK